jgi:hypothetical protein
LTVSNPGAGFAYLRLPDPANGDFRLVRVRRSDGADLDMANNVWTTDRTFIGMSKRPRLEHNIHLFDRDSTGAYTLFYETLPGVDASAPTSSVASLPAQSFTEIPVMWSGQDDTAVSSFDIFVAENDGPFEPWLRNTALQGATFQANPGSSYGFFSVARDAAGNMEPAPMQADAVTLASLVNDAPNIAPIMDQQLDEGATLSLTVTATDPEQGILEYSLDPGAPNGAIIDSETGELTWITTETDGGSTHTIVVRVADNGTPAESASVSFDVTVNEINQPPTFAGPVMRDAPQGGLVSVDFNATDSDAPANDLTYALEPGAPMGASIDPMSGQLTWNIPTDHPLGDTQIGVRVTDNGMPAMSATTTLTVAVARMNHAPTLDVITDPQVDEGSLLMLTASGQDTDDPADNLTYTLAPGAPQGAMLDSDTGVFTWTPDENDGPGTFPVTITVTDDGVPPLSASRPFTINVNEVNEPPTINPIGNRKLNEGDLVTFTASGSDPDRPVNDLTYSLGAGAVPGMAIVPETGAFTWTPTLVAGDNVFNVEIVINDNGNPPMQATTSVEITVTNILKDFTFVIGVSNVMAGEVGGIPLTLETDIAFTEFEADVRYPTSRMSNPRLSSFGPGLETATVTDVEPGVIRLHFTAANGQSLPGNQLLADLEFDAPAGLESGLFHLATIGDMTATQALGGTSALGDGRRGRLIYVNQKPVMDFGHLLDGTVVLYGKPGTSYVVESQAMISSATWTQRQAITLGAAERFRTVTGIDPQLPAEFYRGRETTAP